MNTKEAMDELTIDALSDPEYALPIIRDYLNGGGILSPGWALALVNEIEKLWEEMGINTEETVKQERQHAAALCNAWGHYWAALYTSKLAPTQINTIGWALGEKIKEGESLDVVKAAQERLDIERMPKRRRRL